MAVAGRFGADEAPVYDAAIRRMVPGYDLLHRLVRAELGARIPTTARLLVVGAGTGAELSGLAAAGRGWTFAAVDPAASMLQVARLRAAQEGYGDRVVWHPTHLDEVPIEPGFDAAVMLLVAHFLPLDGAKQALFDGIAARLHGGAPLVFADLAVPAAPGSTEAAVRRSAAVDLGSEVDAAEQMIEGMWRTLHPVDGTDLDGLLVEAGFTAPLPFFQALGYRGWVTCRTGSTARG